MTLRMLDSVTVADLPPGADAYLGYAGGRWPTFAQLRLAFPHAHLVSLAVSAGQEADGCDVEAEDLTPAEVAPWVVRAAARGVWRPVVYASAAAMAGVLAGLEAAGIARASVRLLSAHYGAGEHICGPSTCALRDAAGRVVPACDGTQWRDDAPGLGASKVDESVLADGFFPAPPAPKAKHARETEMILVTIDRGSVPAGTAWPGVFLLTSAGQLLHVTGPDGSINNTESYQAAGIPGPVTISWNEYLARSGRPAAEPAAAAAD